MQKTPTIITITLNRLYYNYHCFKTLKEKAGCEYKHIIVDNGSTDGTEKWLVEEGYNPILNKENKGITYALRQALERCDDGLVIKLDSDCEIVTDGLIKKVVEYCSENKKMIVSPRIGGLHNNLKAKETTNGFERTDFSGGIFRPLKLEEWKEAGDNLRDNRINRFFLDKGYKIGYLPELKANHFETTDGQIERYPQYFNKQYIF